MMMMREVDPFTFMIIFWAAGRWIGKRNELDVSWSEALGQYRGTTDLALTSHVQQRKLGRKLTEKTASIVNYLRSTAHWP